MNASVASSIRSSAASSRSPEEASPQRSPALAPYLVVDGALGLERFMVALGGKPGYRELRPDGGIAHAEMAMGDSVIMFADVPPGRSPFPAMLHLYVEDVDASFRKALAAGDAAVREPVDQRDGDRRGGVRDAWGNEWWFTTPKRRD